MDIFKKWAEMGHNKRLTPIQYRVYYQTLANVDVEDLQNSLSEWDTSKPPAYFPSPNELYDLSLTQFEYKMDGRYPDYKAFSNSKPCDLYGESIRNLINACFIGKTISTSDMMEKFSNIDRHMRDASPPRRKTSADILNDHGISETEVRSYMHSINKKPDPRLIAVFKELYSYGWFIVGVDEKALIIKGLPQTEWEASDILWGEL